MTPASEKILITISAEIKAPVNKVWELWTGIQHIIRWNHASDDWHTTKAENNLKEGGKFLYRMEAKDGSFGFDFSGTYGSIIKNKCINYTIEDGRKTGITFVEHKNVTEVRESFEAEEMHPVDMQREGWQSILNNFKKYVESKYDKQNLPLPLV